MSYIKDEKMSVSTAHPWHLGALASCNRKNSTVVPLECHLKHRKAALFLEVARVERHEMRLV